jgi:very-short-patch-repair endonuclease
VHRSTSPLIKGRFTGNKNIYCNSLNGKFYNIQALKETRRILRKNMTTAEKILWQEIRKKQILGHRFLRQYSIGSIIVDFYSPKIKLAIEVNGAIHDKSDIRELDKEKEETLKNANISVLRFKNDKVLINIEEVLDIIRKKIIEISKITTSPSRLHIGTPPLY